MSNTFDKSLDYSAVPTTTRSRLPDFLYIVVHDTAFSTIGSPHGALTTSRTNSYYAKRAFTWIEVTKRGIEKHLRYKSWEVEESSFLSAYDSEATALRFPPFSSASTYKGRNHHAIKLNLDTHGLVPAWAITTAGTQIPIWIEQGALPKVPKGVLHMTPEGFNAFEAGAWICLDEVRAMLGLKESDGEKGEWLACGYIPKTRVCGQVVLHGVKTTGRKLIDNELAPVSKIRRQERERKMLKDSLQPGVVPPPIPVRTSSLRSYLSDDGNQRKRGNTLEGTSRLHRSFDSKNQRNVKRAQSLLKKALIMSADEVETERLLQEVNNMHIHREVKIAERRHESSPSRHSPSAAPQNSPSDVVSTSEELSGASLTRDPPPTQSTLRGPRTDTPTSSISLRTLAWFDRIERNPNRGIELKARIAEARARQQRDQEREGRDSAMDCSTYYIPEHFCSEAVLNERLDLPEPTPDQSARDSEEGSVVSETSTIRDGRRPRGRSELSSVINIENPD